MQRAGAMLDPMTAALLCNMKSAAPPQRRHKTLRRQF